ncbi:MAG: DUF935 domain-containing protein [Syntrophobacteraceae bacterium]|nr:DUF935 domain-containing protein [Desulfobacteraceae bacterium]
MLYDQFGREIRAGDLKRPDTREISVQQVRDRWSTYPSSGLNPRRLANILKAADNGDMLRQAELFEEMEEKDAHLASQFQTRKLAVQGLPWEILPTSKDPLDKKSAEFCRQTLAGLPDLDGHILDMLDALPKGYSVMEIMWDASSGLASISSLNWIHPKKITFWDSIHPRILTEEEPVRGVDPPGHKIVYHRYKARSGHDTRAGIMRVCAWMYLFKNFAIKDWAAFAEIFGMPIRIGKYEPGANRADKDALLAAIRSIGTDAAGIISKSTEIEFVEAQKSGGTSGQNIYESLVRFCDAQMSKAILGQVLTADAGGEKGQGSYALGRVHGEVRQDLVEADCSALSRTITEQIIRPLVGFNDPRGWSAPVPQFRFLYDPPEDFKAIAEIYKIICGDLGKPVSEEHLSERFKIPMPKKGETVLNVPKQKPVSNLAKFMAKAVASRSDVSDLISDELQKETDSKSDAMIDKVRDLVNEANSLEEVRDRLITLTEGMDPQSIGEIMGMALTVANLSGRFDAGRAH